MKPPPFRYSRPESVTEALMLLDDEAKVLAGGQSLVPLLNMRLAAPEHLVDINRLTALSYVTAANGAVRVGALARHADVLASEPAAAAQPLLRQALRWVAHPAIRNRGTTVGSLVHADPAGEMPAVLVLLGGTMRVASTAGERSIPAGDFFLGPLESAVQPGELAIEAEFPALARRGTGTGFAEISRRRGDYAVCGVATLAWLGADGRVAGASAAYLSMGPVPVLLDLTDAVAGAAADAASFPAVAGLVRDQLDPQPDIHATASYRRHLAGVLTERALLEALVRARETNERPLPQPVSVSDEEVAEQRRRLGNSPQHVSPQQTPETGQDDGLSTHTAANPEGRRKVRLTVNGAARTANVPARRLLSDCLRHDLHLTGTHVGCEHGVCGACTVLLDGAPVRSCLLLAASADGSDITTVEGLADAGGALSPVQRAFAECHGLQCGFCTPGFLTTITAGLAATPDPDDEQARDMIGGNLCRCTGYQNILAAVHRAAEITREGATTEERA